MELVWTLVAVVVGAATSYIVAIATERTRWKRADQVWRNAQRIDAHAEFAHRHRQGTGCWLTPKSSKGWLITD